MNKMTFASLAAVAVALVGSPIRADAGHRSHHDHDGEVIAAIGGFVGGLIVGSALDRDPAPAVTVAYGHDHHRRHGHWELRKVRVWVPGHWAYVDRGRGPARRVWIEGYYDVRRERVWVAHRPSCRCG